MSNKRPKQYKREKLTPQQKASKEHVQRPPTLPRTRPNNQLYKIEEPFTKNDMVVNAENR